jgi:hypothetical protein
MAKVLTDDKGNPLWIPAGDPKRAKWAEEFYGISERGAFEFYRNIVGSPTGWPSYYGPAPDPNFWFNTFLKYVDEVKKVIKPQKGPDTRPIWFPFWLAYDFETEEEVDEYLSRYAHKLKGFDWWKQCSGLCGLADSYATWLYNVTSRILVTDLDWSRNGVQWLIIDEYKHYLGPIKFALKYNIASVPVRYGYYSKITLELKWPMLSARNGLTIVTKDGRKLKFPNLPLLKYRIIANPPSLPTGPFPLGENPGEREYFKLLHNMRQFHEDLRNFWDDVQAYIFLRMLELPFILSVEASSDKPSADPDTFVALRYIFDEIVRSFWSEIISLPEMASTMSSWRHDPTGFVDPVPFFRAARKAFVRVSPPPSTATPAPTATTTPPSTATPVPTATTTPPSTATPVPTATTTPPSTATPAPTTVTSTAEAPKATMNLGVLAALAIAAIILFRNRKRRSKMPIGPKLEVVLYYYGYF